MDSISVQVCAYWVAGKIIDMAVEKKLSTIRAAPRRLRETWLGWRECSGGGYSPHRCPSDQRRRSTFGTPSRHAERRTQKRPVPLSILQRCKPMQTRQVHQRSVVDVDVRYTMLYLLAIATWRGMETFLATILNTSQIKIYE